MSESAVLWIREAEVVRVLDLAAAIPALESALAAEAAGAVSHLEKTHATFGRGDTLHALGAVVAGDAGSRAAVGGDDAGSKAAGAGGNAALAIAGTAGLAGTKTWAHTGGGATPLLVLWRARGGALVAVIEAFALGQLRTSGISAVATRLLAAPEADELGVIGSGKQALGQVAAAAAVRRLRGVRGFSPTPAHRERFAARVASELGVPARAVASVADCARDAAIVTTVTRATEPFLAGDVLARGAHVNAVGAIVPERAEVAASALGRVDLAVADSPAQAVRLSRELGDGWNPAGTTAGASVGAGMDARAGAPGQRPLFALCDVVAGRAVRPAAPDVTLFKAMGMGLADVALGAVVLARARELGLGVAIAAPERAVPRLSTRRREERS